MNSAKEMTQNNGSGDDNSESGSERTFITSSSQVFAAPQQGTQSGTKELYFYHVTNQNDNYTTEIDFCEQNNINRQP